FRRQADDPGEPAFAQLAGYCAEDARAARVLFCVKNYHRIAVKPHVAAVFTPLGLFGANYHARNHIARLHFAAGDSLLNARLDHIADAGIASPAAAEHFNAHALLGAGIIRDVQIRIHLNQRPPSFHRSSSSFVASDAQGVADDSSPVPSGPSINGAAAGALRTMRISRQCFNFDKGRDSMISTVSPQCDSFCSSWTWQIVRRRMYLPYRACLTRRGISTRRDLFILSLVTMPISTRRLPRLVVSITCFPPQRPPSREPTAVRAESS